MAAQNRRGPPGGRGQPSEDVVVAAGFDASRDKPPVQKKQAARRRRKHAAGLRPLGPGEVAALDAPQGQHLTRSTEPGISYLSGATSYDFIPPNWRRLGFVLGQVFGDWSKD